ncbi:MAG: winged helix-turn-helix domain-containing protein [Phycisphaerales bacterium]|nr:winged helix-turn-helix domain-containing protein [Phycisphaerales bacterium]
MTTPTKKTTKKSTAKKTTSKAAAKKAPAKKTTRTTASAARAEGAAKTKRARQAKAAPQDHEVPSPKEIANDANLEAYAKSKAPRKPRSKKTTVAPGDAKRTSGLDFAAAVLAKAGEPLAAKAIAERAIAAGWKTSGKTPHATLYAAITREIARKGDAARFKKTDRGLFAAAGAKGGR